MTSHPVSCPKCQGEMVQGFVVDRGNANAPLVSTWAAGQPAKSFWHGTKTGEQLPIGSFRCSRCGYLESYAGTEFAAR